MQYNHILHKVFARYFQGPPGTTHSYYNTIDYIPCAVLSTPVTVL